VRAFLGRVRFWVQHSSLVGYDGGQYLRVEEHLVERKKPARKKGPALKKDSRWGFHGMTVRNWLELLIVPLVLAGIGFWFTAQQDARMQQIEDQRAASDRKLEDQRAQDAALQARSRESSMWLK
jgi:hypothetical protein